MRGNPDTGWWWISRLLWLCATLWITTTLDAPAAPTGTPPVTDFSASRAVTTLERIIDADRPHFAGSTGADETRARILRELEALGVPYTVEADFACTSSGHRCAHLHNVLATLGTPSETQPAILLAVHYDAVPAAPGAGDDGIGVAVVMEILRAWKASDTPWPLQVLLDEGEELGLLGAKAFVQRPEALANVGLVINLEARGTAGRAIMFETAGAADPWLHRFAAVVPSPSANSMTAEVADRLPNDTDLTVFNAAGATGLNFAIIDGLARYHTARDDVAHLDRDSVQHMGDQVLALLRSVPEQGWPDPSSAPLTYTDVVGHAVLHWPESWTLWLAALCALAALARTVIYVRSAAQGAGARVRVLAHAWGRTLAMPALTFGICWLIHEVVSWWLGVPTPGYAHPWPLRMVVVAATIVAHRWCAQRARDARVRHLVYLTGVTTWTVIALAIAIAASSAAVMWMVPAFLATIAVWMIPAPDRPRGLASTLVVAASGCLSICVWIPLVYALDLSFGPSPTPWLGVLAGALGWLFPSPPHDDHDGRATRPISRIWEGLALVALTVAAGSVAPFSSDAPQPLSLVRVEAHGRDGDAAAALAWGGWGPDAPRPVEIDSGQSWGTFQDLPRDMPPHLRQVLLGAPWHLHAVPVSSTPPPRIEATRLDATTVLVSLTARRGGHITTLGLQNANDRIVDVDGHPMENATPRAVTVFGAIHHTATFTVEHVGDTIELWGAETVLGVHALDRARSETRPAWTAPRQTGDHHTVITEVVLPTPF